MMFLNKIDNFKCMECGNLSSIPRIYVERMRRAELLTECVVCAIGRRGVITSPPLGIMAPLHPLPGFLVTCTLHFPARALSLTLVVEKCAGEELRCRGICRHQGSLWHGDNDRLSEKRGPVWDLCPQGILRGSFFLC